MALKENVFTPNLVELLDALTDLRFTANLQELVTKRAIGADGKEAKRADLKVKPKFGAFFYGTTLPVSEYFHSKNWEDLLVTSQYERQNATEDDAHDLALEVDGRFQAQVICAVFEVMEDYLRKIGGKLLFQTRSQLSKKVQIRFDRKAIESRMRKGIKQKAGTIEYYEEYMRQEYRKGYAPFLEELHAKLPSVHSEIKYQRALTQLTNFYRAVQFIRHHTVHNNGRYDEKKLRELTADDQASIRSMTRHSVLFKANMILPSREAAEAIVRHMSALGLFLHQCLGHDLGMKLTWPAKKPLTKK